MRNHVMWVGILVLALNSLDCLAADEKVFNFEQSEIGKTPAGFSAALTGNGRNGVWVIENDPSAPASAKVLAQTGKDDTSGRYPVCIHDGLKASDVEASVQFKAVSGTVDQAAGLVVRYQDKDNYYIVRANSLEDNVRLYHFVKGKRTQFAGRDVEVSPGKWHTLRIKAVGRHFTVSLNGKDLFEADDGAFSTAGRVGLWTKADSVARFDDVRITSLDAK